jgi:hypothetical protein|tara:strand:- start:6361 stop:6696 length:336 start_codon:yes stop_codon:yes gene_type:complete
MNTDSTEKIISLVHVLIAYYNEPDIKKEMLENKDECIKKTLDVHGDFFDKYPALFHMISNNPYNFEMDRLVDMLNLKKKVTNKEVSYKDASVGIGYKYYDEFVKPGLNDSN